MRGRPPGARRRLRRAATWIAFALAGAGAAAQSDSEAEKVVGFPAGPFVIGPSLTTGYSYDSNVYLRPETVDTPSDQVLTVEPALQLTVPFSNSAFRLADTLRYVDYSHTPQTAGKSSNDAVAELVLNFASRDKLDLSAHHIAGVAETLAFDPGGAFTFSGNSFRLHTETVAISREIAGARGYRVAIERNALTFDRSVDTVPFVDYRGFDGECAYLQPLSSNTRLAFGYRGARYDQFNLGSICSPNEVCRTENGNAVYAQIEGQLGPKQPYYVRLGWERLDFGLNAAPGDYSGLIGQVNMSAIVGGGTKVTFVAVRQPYRSSVPGNNFYLFDQIGGKIERPFPQGSLVGGEMSFSQGAYDQAATPEPEAPSVLRRDRTIRLEVYANLVVADHVVFRVSFLKNRRYSNFPGADYNATVIFGGFVLGWS
jgi:hypothetical protein